MRDVPTAGGPIETGSQCLNTLDDDGDTLVNDGCPTYLLHDHLGSTVEALDAAGNTIVGSEIRYWPYGVTRAGGVALREFPLESGYGFADYLLYIAREAEAEVETNLKRSQVLRQDTLSSSFERECLHG